MMSKRKKLVVIAVVAVIALTAGLATFALAQENPTEGNTDKSPVRTFISKVASILDFKDEQFIDAAKQARQEMINEAIEKRLAKAVEKGLIDEAEAGQIMNWWQNRPEALNDLGRGVGSCIKERWRQQRFMHRMPCE